MSTPEHETITDPEALASYTPRVGDLVTERVTDVGSQTDDGHYDGTIVRVERPAPPTPGTVGTATVRGQRGVRVMRVEVGQPYQEPGIDTLWRSAQGVPGGSSVFYNHDDDEVADFVPDADTAALTRADAAEARLARVTALLDAPGGNVSCAGTDLATDGCFAHNLAVRIRALVADDEQAAEGKACAICTARPTDVILPGANLPLCQEHFNTWISRYVLGGNEPPCAAHLIVPTVVSVPGVGGAA